MKPIRDEKSHRDALARVDALLTANPDIEPGTTAGDELDVLIDLIEHYESKQETFATPSALSAIAFRMEQAGLKPRDLIPFIGSRAKVSEVLSGKRPITLPMARALHKNLGIPADLLLADEPEDQEAREWDRFPIKALRQIGVITKAFKSAEAAVRDLMTRAQCIDPLPMYRRNDHNRRNAKTDPYALEAWCLGVLAKSFEVVEKGSYRKGSVTPKTMASVAALSVLDDGPRKAQDYLASQHVALVVLPHLPQTHLDGAILSRSDNVPVIGMTLRYDRVDYFWFCLMHELAHLVRHLDKGLATEFFDDLSIAPMMDLEKEADELATDILIPPDVWASSAAKADPTALSICSLANAIGRSPAIVAGRVRHETRNFRLLTHFVGQGMVRKHFGDQWFSKEQGRSSSSGPVKTGPSPVGSVADSRMSGTAKLPQVAEQSQGRQRRGLRQSKAKL